MKLGYARVSTNEQDTAAQVNQQVARRYLEKRRPAVDGTDPR
jgi:DNA invertase Pin-like site-specific DNA recombinase